MKSNWIGAATMFVGTVAILGVVSGCGKQSHESKPEVLRVWQTETDKGALQQFDAMIAKFERENPGTKIEHEPVAWNSLAAKLAVAVRSGNEPDVAHLEPFMVASLKQQNLLLPITDVIKDIEKASGDEILHSVRDLQEFNGERYGIAYAVGTTGWSYRKDVADELGLQPPKKWKDYITFVATINAHKPGLRVLLPGGDPFFIDQLFGELVANNGGILFDASNPAAIKPVLTDKKVIEVFEFFRDLAPYVDGNWQTQPYLDQFSRLARGEASSVPVTYVRAAKTITTVLGTNATVAGQLEASPKSFALMPQPTGPSYDGPSIATIDCEPYVVFRSTPHPELAKKFLRYFYRKDNYLPFVKQVPIHLTPIFRGMAQSPDYLSAPLITRWSQWADQTRLFLGDENRVRPILMPDLSENGRNVPFLLEFQSQEILLRAVVSVMKNRVAPEEAARIAQAEAEKFIASLPLK